MHPDNNFSQVITNPPLAYLSELLGFAIRCVDVERRTIRLGRLTRLHYFGALASPLSFPKPQHIVHLQCLGQLVGDKQHGDFAFEFIDGAREVFGGGLTRLLTASSKISMCGRLSRARAMAMRWRCPPGRPMPFSPAGVW